VQPMLTFERNLSVISPEHARMSPIYFNLEPGKDTSMAANNVLGKFLSKHRLLASQYDPKAIIASFLEEMEKGLCGQKSCLAMIPSYITLPDKAPKNETIIVLDAGGTNFRTALIRFDARSVPHIEYFTNYAMPGTERELTNEEFFNTIADYIKPVLGKSNRIGFCFSYPATIDRTRDGTLLYWTKEIKAPGVVGKKIAASLVATLQNRKLPRPASILILNDTVASLLAGVSATKFLREYRYVGFILGTGTNTAYIESNARITKEKGLDPSGSQAINIEAANFNKIERGDIDIAFDRKTNSPGKHVLEKMISGGYIGPFCHAALNAAAAERVLSPAAGRTLLEHPPFETRDLDSIIEGSFASKGALSSLAKADASAVRTMVTEIVERAAVLTAANLAAGVIKAADGGKGGKKVCISADGSVYYKLYSFRQRAEKVLTRVLEPYGITCEIVKVADAPIIGTAVAGLSG
jgi:hexokinase